MKAFTLIELLVVIAIIAILAAILFPVFAEAKAAAKKAACISNLHQIGLGFEMYRDDNDSLNPDRPDLKTSLPGGFRPWSSWPPSDPRGGWAAYLLDPYLKSDAIWECPSEQGSALGTTIQAMQPWGAAPAKVAGYWLWRFDRPDFPVPLTDCWGKSDDQMVNDLDIANDPTVGHPQSDAEVELAVDPYFPATIPTVSLGLKGKSTHSGGRNRLFFDGHAHWLEDSRLHA